MRRGIVSGTTLACLTLWACDPVGPGEVEKTADIQESAARGSVLFLEYCALCHGERGDGAGVRRGSLSRPPANFRGPLFVPDPARVRRAIRDGIAGSDMPPWQRLGDQAIDDLTRYVLALSRSSR
jgi:high-affinity iron transporter